MPLTAAEILHASPDDGSSVERFARRTRKLPLTICEPNPEWPKRFQDLKKRITAALAPETIVEINHAGSTSVPGLPAKDCIDIDLVVARIDEEGKYVKQVEGVGFTFLFRERAWYEHRFFVAVAISDSAIPYFVNLHVFPPDCAEVERHRIFRDWLVQHPEDLELYARTKREASSASEKAGEGAQEYTVRKGDVVAAILNRAYSALGYVQ